MDDHRRLAAAGVGRVGAGAAPVGARPRMDAQARAAGQAAREGVAAGAAVESPEGSAAGGSRSLAGVAGGAAAGARVAVRTLGGLVLEVDGRRVPLDGVKPRVRSLLRLLALQAGGPVHREVIQETLWPDADAAAGARSLHVALSALRKLLDDVADPPGGRLIARDGDAYRLAVAPEDVDLGRFDHAIAAGRSARARGRDRGGGVRRPPSTCTRATCCPEEGPAEWVAERRDQYRARAIEAARAARRGGAARGRPADGRARVPVRPRAGPLPGRPVAAAHRGPRARLARRARHHATGATTHSSSRRSASRRTRRPRPAEQARAGDWAPSPASA